MRTTHTTIACCVFVLAVTPVVLTHCSSSSARLRASNGSGGSSGGQGSSSGQGSSNGGTSSSSSSGDDGGGGTSNSSGGSSMEVGRRRHQEPRRLRRRRGGRHRRRRRDARPRGRRPERSRLRLLRQLHCNTTTQHCCVGSRRRHLRSAQQELHRRGQGRSPSRATVPDCAPGNVCCQPLEYGRTRPRACRRAQSAPTSRFAVPTRSAGPQTQAPPRSGARSSRPASPAWR